ADAGRARDAEADRLAGLGHHEVEQLLRLQPVILAPRFHQRDAARQGATVAGFYLVGEVLLAHFAASGILGGEASMSSAWSTPRSLRSAASCWRHHIAAYMPSCCSNSPWRPRAA